MTFVPAPAIKATLDTVDLTPFGRGSGRRTTDPDRPTPAPPSRDGSADHPVTPFVSFDSTPVATLSLLEVITNQLQKRNDFTRFTRRTALRGGRSLSQSAAPDCSKIYFAVHNVRYCFDFICTSIAAGGGS